jgi:hypothetical protein
MSSEKFGLSHRQLVKDTNEGRIVEQPAAPSAARGINAVRPGRSDKTIDTDNGSRRRLTNSLISAAGAVGGVMQKEQDRRAAIAGYNWAGTEQGKKEVDEASQSLGSILFGPRPKLKAAQERIVKDSVDQIGTKLQLDLKDFGHSMPEEEWQAHVAAELANKLAKYDSDDIKDLITMRFGQNLSAVSREYTKAHHLFLQNEERETFMDSVQQSSQTAFNDFQSGDPNRVADGAQRLQEGLTKPEGMTDEAYRSAISTVVKRELADSRPGLYVAAEQAGILDELDEDDRAELEGVYEAYQARNDATQLQRLNELRYLADNGEDHVEQVTAIAKQLQQGNPELFGKAGVADIVGRAFDRQQAVLESRRARAQRKAQAVAGDPALLRESPTDRVVAVQDVLDEMADRNIKEEMRESANRMGVPITVPDEISPWQRRQWLLDNVDKWSRTWAINGVPTDQVTQIGKEVVNDIGRLDLDWNGAQTLKNNLDSLMQLRSQKPELWAKQFSAEDGARLMAYHKAINIKGENPYEAVKRLRAKEEEGKKKGKTKKVNVPKEQLSDAVAEIGEAFVRDNGEWSWNPFRHAGGFLAGVGDATISMIPGGQSPVEAFTMTYRDLAKADPDLRADLDRQAEKLYIEEYGRTHNHELATAYAQNQLHKKSSVIGGRFVLNGAVLDDNSVNGDFQRYLVGLNDSETFRQRAVLEHGLPADFDLRKATSISVNPDGTGATFYFIAEDQSIRTLPLTVPTKREHILPTDGDRFFEGAKEVLLEQRQGGSFGPTFSAAQERAQEATNQ